MARVRLDHRGMAEILKSAEVAAAVEEVALAAGVRAEAHPSVVAHGVDVRVDSYETDRAAASVTLAHPAGLNIERKYGVLTDAASAQGLDVSDGTE